MAKDIEEILHQLSLLNENVSSMRRELNHIDERVAVVECRARGGDDVTSPASHEPYKRSEVSAAGSNGSVEAISLMELNTPAHKGMVFKLFCISMNVFVLSKMLKVIFSTFYPFLFFKFIFPKTYLFLFFT